MPPILGVFLVGGGCQHNPSPNISRFISSTTVWVLPEVYNSQKPLKRYIYNVYTIAKRKGVLNVILFQSTPKNPDPSKVAILLRTPPTPVCHTGSLKNPSMLAKSQHWGHVTPSNQQFGSPFAATPVVTIRAPKKDIHGIQIQVGLMLFLDVFVE